jgi:preprotein translocase subunit SecG
MLTVVIVIHLMIVLAMIGVVLLQKSEGGGLVSTSNSGFMTGRGTANVLTRTTAFLAIGFFVTSLILSWLAGLGRHPASIINPVGAPMSQEAPPAPAPGPAAPPLSQSGRGVLEQLGGKAPGSEAPTPAPSGPQVPRSQ